jgi:hypothetical protein
MFVSRRNCGICLLALALALVGSGWSQSAPPPASGQADVYAQAVALLEQAQQQVTTGNPSAALALVKQSNELFTRLQKECAAALAERQLSPQDDQQLAINQKLAADAQAQADRLIETAAAKKKRGQARTLSIKAAIYALRNQQIIFRFLAP